MAVQKTRKAFRGNIRRAMRRLISAEGSMSRWQDQHADWPVELLSDAQATQLHQLVVVILDKLNATYPVGP